MSEINTAVLERPVLQELPVEPEHSVFIDKLAIPCESKSVHPCIEKHPLPATLMVRYEECDCDVEPEDLVIALCDGCFHRIYDSAAKAPFVICNCGIKFQPGKAYFADIVELPK